MGNALKEILKLNKDERIKAASILLNSILEDESETLTTAQKKRIELFESGHLRFSSWEEVYAGIRSKKR
jgi:Putative addiction module component